MKTTKSSKSAAAIKPTLDAKTAVLRAKRLERDAAKPTATPPTPPAKPEPKRGVGYHIRKAVIAAYPTELTNEAIDAELVAAGITGTKRSTIATSKQDTLNTLRVCEQLGRLIVEPAATATAASAPQSSSEMATEPALTH